MIHEILLEASEANVDQLLAGLSPEEATQVIRGDELHLETESFSERIRDLLGARTHRLLFAPPATTRILVEAARREPEVRLEGRREIESAAFSFQVEAFSEPVRDEIRGFLCSSLPSGVRLTGFAEKEERDPEAEGVELFAPAHAYTWRAEGRIEGEPGAVLDLQRRAVAHDFCHPGPLQLSGRELNDSERA